MISAALLVLLTLAALNRVVGRSWLYPPAAFTALWFLALLVLWCCGDMFYPISGGTLVTYALGSVFFTVGGLLISFLLPATRPRIPCPNRVRLRHIRTVLDVGLGVSIVLLPRYLLYLAELSSRSGLSNFWQGVKMGSIEVNDLPGGGPFRLEAWLLPIYSILALVTYSEYDGSRAWRWRTRAWIGVALLYQLLTTSKSEVMLLMVGLIAVDWIKRRRTPVRLLVLCAAGFIVLFIANSIILEKDGARTDVGLSKNAPALLEGGASYAVGSLVGFDSVVTHPMPVANTWKLYKFFVHAANKLGGNYTELSQNLRYTNISPHLVTNTYTIYFAYFMDFGLLGVAVLSLLVGAVTTLVYHSAVRQSPLGVILFCAALYGIVMSIFAELFFVEIGFWLKSVAVVTALYYLPPIFGRSTRAGTRRPLPA